MLGGTAFEGADAQDATEVSFNAGTAILHRGQHWHEALPLESGEHVTLVIWIFGNNRDVRVAEYPEEERHTKEEVEEGVE